MTMMPEVLSFVSAFKTIAREGPLEARNDEQPDNSKEAATRSRTYLYFFPGTLPGIGASSEGMGGNRRALRDVLRENRPRDRDARAGSCFS